MSYISSIVTKYGDLENVKKDVQALNSILGRQGVSLLIDVIAESCGDVANKHKLNDADRARIISATVDELNEALKERL